MTSDVFKKLDVQQFRAATAPRDAPLVVIAGAGSGKTTTLVARIAHLHETLDGQQQVLAITHTTKAAGELAERCLAAGLINVTTGTVHSAALKVVREFPNQSGLPTGFTIAKSILGYLAAAAQTALGRRLEKDSLLDLATEIDWCRSRLMSPDDLGAPQHRMRVVGSLSAHEVADVWRALMQEKLRHGVADFGDVLDGATRALRAPDVREWVDARWSAVVLDEFQDTDRQQFSFVQAVLGESPRLSVVGDPRQTIYSFKGADRSLLADLSRRAGTTSVHLTHSYRCSKKICAASNKLVGTAYGPGLDATADGPDVTLVVARDQDDEFDSVATQLSQWHKEGVAWSDMAVLYRFNAQAARAQAALAAAGIPRATTGEGFFEKEEVLAVLRPFGKAARGTPDADGLKLLERQVAQQGWDLSNPPDGVGRARQRFENVAALVELARQESAPRHGSLSAGVLLEQLLAAAKTDSQGVTTSTIHAAKGLEWSAVVVTGCCEGSIPSLYATDTSDVEEERRLLYVAMTRARTHLVLSAHSRFGKNHVSLSRFLTGLPIMRGRAEAATANGAIGKSAGPKSAPKVRGLDCSRCGSRLVGRGARRLGACSGDCLTGATRENFDALRNWAADRGLKASDTQLLHVLALGTPPPGWPEQIVLPDFLL